MLCYVALFICRVKFIQLNISLFILYLLGLFCVDIHDYIKWNYLFYVRCDKRERILDFGAAFPRPLAISWQKETLGGIIRVTLDDFTCYWHSWGGPPLVPGSAAPVLRVISGRVLRWEFEYPGVGGSSGILLSHLSNVLLKVMEQETDWWVTVVYMGVESCIN